MPDLMDFFFYTAYDEDFKYRYLGDSKAKRNIYMMVIEFLERYRKAMKKALNESKRFHAPAHIKDLGRMASQILSLGNQTGEGWFLTGEMIELIESGTSNIICMQPFACLPNHVTGKGMIKALKEKYPEANIVAVDYDPGASEVNQLNRIKLMLSVAFKKLEGEMFIDLPAHKENQTGEGWFLTGEMIELIESGTSNIICMQPFACLPNHVTGKGMIKALKEKYPEANIVAVDYDPGASEVNQLNRIKLMLSVAFKKLEGEMFIDLPAHKEASITEETLITIE